MRFYETEVLVKDSYFITGGVTNSNLDYSAISANLILLRLEEPGFFNINTNEIDTFRKLGMPAYPPSDGKMCYINACNLKIEKQKIPVKSLLVT